MIPAEGVPKPKRKAGPVERWVDANYCFKPFGRGHAPNVGKHYLAGVPVDYGFDCRWRNETRGMVIRVIKAYRRAVRAESGAR